MSTHSDADSASLDAREFGARFSVCAPRLWTVAFAVLGDRGLSEDAVQEAALIGLKKRASFRPDSNFEAWMASLVRFTALNSLRKRRGLAALEARDAEREFSEGGVASSAPVSSTADSRAPLEESFDDEVVRALDTLPFVARAALLLRSVHELDYREIAELLSIREGTAMSHVHRARTALRDRLREHSWARRGAGGLA